MNGQAGALGPPGFTIQAQDHEAVAKDEGKARKSHGRSIITLTGIARQLREEHLKSAVNPHNSGFLDCHIFTSCTCQPCKEPFQHPRNCLCLPCMVPDHHCTWALFFFKDAQAAEMEFEILCHRLVMVLGNAVHWTPHMLTMQHSIPHALMPGEPEQGNPIHGNDEAPPPPPLPQETFEELEDWNNSVYHKNWLELLACKKVIAASSPLQEGQVQPLQPG